MKLKHSFFLIITLLLFASNGLAQRLPEEPMRFHKDYTENGLIFGTISFTNTKARYNGYFPYISCISEDKKKSRKNSGQIIIRPEQIFKMRHDGELEDGKTYLFTMEKAPGQYTLSSIRLFTNGVLGYTRTDVISGFSIPFEVKKGEILYVGEITINEYAENNGPILSIDDQFDRDVQAMKNRQKMINWDAATKSELTIIRN